MNSKDIIEIPDENQERLIRLFAVYHYTQQFASVQGRKASSLLNKFWVAVRQTVPLDDAYAYDVDIKDGKLQIHKVGPHLEPDRACGLDMMDELAALGDKYDLISEEIAALEKKLDGTETV